MKVYLVQHKGYAPSPANMDAWVDYEGTASEFTASVHVMSVRAFLKRRYADDYIAKLPDGVREHREIVAFSTPQRARTRPPGKSSATPRRNKKDALKRDRARKRHVRSMEGGCSCGAPSEVSCAEWKAAQK